MARKKGNGGDGGGEGSSGRRKSQKLAATLGLRGSRKSISGSKGPSANSSNSNLNEGGGGASATAGQYPSTMGLSEDQRAHLIDIFPLIIQHLRNMGLTYDGLFIRGEEAVDTQSIDMPKQAPDAIRQLLAAVSGGPESNNSDVTLAQFPIHVWANALKKTVKEMQGGPVPLVSAPIAARLVVPQSNPSERVDNCRKVLEDLPHRNFSVFRSLCTLLSRCASDNSKLGFMFGALLLLPAVGSVTDEAAVTKSAVEVMELLINETDNVFGGGQDIAAASGLFGNASANHAAPPPVELTAPPPVAPRPPQSFNSNTNNPVSSPLSMPPAPPPPARDFHPIGAAPTPPAQQPQQQQQQQQQQEEDDDDDNEISNITRQLACVKFDFAANGEEELAVTAGEELEVVAQEEDGWTVVRRVLENGVVQEGIIPSAYCDVVERVEEPPSPVAEVTNNFGNNNSGTQVEVTVAPAAAAGVTWLEAQYAFEPQDDGEMALEVGQRLELIESDDPEWWLGRNQNGQEGLFPAAYVTVLEPAQEQLQDINTTNSYIMPHASPAVGLGNDAALSLSPVTVPEQQQQKQKQSREVTATTAAAEPPMRNDTRGPPPARSQPPARGGGSATSTVSNGVQPPAERTRTSVFGSTTNAESEYEKCKRELEEERLAAGPRPVVNEPSHTELAERARALATPPPTLVRVPGQQHQAGPPHRTGAPAPPPKPTAAAPPPPQRMAHVQQPVAMRPNVSGHTPGPPARSQTQQPVPPVPAPSVPVPPVPVARSGGGAAAAIDPAAAGWTFNPENLKFYLGFFDKMKVNDAQGNAYVEGRTAAHFLTKSALDMPTIARILELADLDKDHKLDKDEFVVAHHLTLCISKRNMPIPNHLPRYLVPKSKRELVLARMQGQRQGGGR